MGLRINTNVASVNAQRNLRGTNGDMRRAMERLSSGSRINRAGDDAAGLAISENLKAQIRGFNMAMRNSEDGISLVQVAEGGLNETSNILARLRELGIQAASDTIGEQERGFLDVEYQSLLNEIERISQATEFNNTKLLNGVAGLAEGATKVFDLQIGIRNTPGVDRIVFDASKADATVQGLGLAQLNVGSKLAAQTSLNQIDQAIARVAAVRADFGALQNRLQSTINNLGVSVENLSSANSRVRDADMAVETAEMTRNNIMLNAGISVLGQANSSNQMALKLLQ